MAVLSRKPLVFFHGLEGSPTGYKGSFLQSRYPDLIAPYLSSDLEERLTVALGAVVEPSVIVGSSLGAVTALMFAQKRPDLVLGLVLLAPAVGYYDWTLVPTNKQQLIRQLSIPAKIPCQVIAAQQDEIIPPQAVVDFVAKAPTVEWVDLQFVEDNHGLGKSLVQMNQAIEALMEN